MDYDYELHKQELDEQLRSGLDWDDYDPEHYGWWQKSRTRKIRKSNNLELANEFGLISVPHRTRHFLSVK